MFAVGPRVIAASVALVFAVGPTAAQTSSTITADPSSVYEAAYTPDERIIMQVLLIASGHYNGIPSSNFSSRLLRAIQHFQAENGFAPDGLVSRPVFEKMVLAADPMMRWWGFQKVAHPQRRVTIWVPLGLGLKAERTATGINFSDPQRRLNIDFATLANTDVARSHADILGGLVRKGARIVYNTLKGSWFAAAVTGPNGVHGYLRFHQDGSNVTGFTILWNNANGAVSGDRIAVLMSASLWADQTGARFIEPPYVQTNSGGSAPESNSGAQARREVATVAIPAPAPRKTEVPVSTGTGFFISHDGSLITNAHVVENCGTLRVRTSDGTFRSATIVSRDATNDLALLRTGRAQDQIASLRTDARLGEAAATFGFPHADVLASTGNFTAGNVTALVGLGDDSRFLQTSAPVQSGNSGGPLLDQSGNTIGVVTGKLDALKVAAAGGDLPQNVNFAVKAALVATFLEAGQIAYQRGRTPAEPLGPAALAERAKAMSAMVVCGPAQ